MRTLILTVDLGSPDYAAHAEEFVMLARGAGAEIVDIVRARREIFHWIGQGRGSRAGRQDP